MLQIKPLLVNAFSLLYRENQLQDSGTNSKPFIQNILNQYVKINDMNLDIDLENRVLGNVKTLIIKMTRDPVEKLYQRDDILRDFRIACEHDNFMYELIAESVMTDYNREELSKNILNTQGKITTAIEEEKLRNFAREFARKIQYESDSIPDMHEYITDATLTLTGFQENMLSKNKLNKSVLMRVTSDSISEIASVVDKATEELNATSIIPTPYKFLNNMLQGGWRRGQTHTVASLTHNYKTGMVLDSFIGACIFADPMKSCDFPEKQQGIVLIVAEDTANTVMNKIFFRLFMHFEERVLSLAEAQTFTSEYISNYMYEKLTRKGWRFILYKVDPSECTYHDIRDIIQGIEAENTEIQWMAIDYLAMCSTKGCKQGFTGQDIQDLFNKVRTICTVRNIAFLTPHQLSPDAENLSREGHDTNFVNIISSGSFYAGTRGVAKEVDCETFTHIVERGDKKYLTVRRGKHRLPTQTPQKYLYAVMPFTDRGLIFDYELDVDLSQPRVGSVQPDDENELSW